MTQRKQGAPGAQIRQDRRKALAATAGWLGGGSVLSQLAHAQQGGNWPDRPVKVVVPYAPGGSADTLGRLIAVHLQNAFKQPFVIENRGGAGGAIGSLQVSRAAPDGYTLVVSGIGSHVIAPVENKTYNPVTDFTHIAMLGGPPTALAVHPSLGVSNVRELIAYAKAHKEGVSWGSPGQGTHAHLLGELFWRAAGGNNTHISYKGAGPAMADLVAGQIPMTFSTFTSVNAHINSGKVRGLALTSEARLPDYPNLPTFIELGFPQVTGTTWFSLSGPPGMSPALVDRINAEVRRGLKTESARKMLAQESIETKDWDAATFTAYLKREVEKWTPLAQTVVNKGK